MGSYADMDDQQLAHLAREDHDAFEVLYRRHVTPVFRYCYARKVSEPCRFSATNLHAANI